MDEINNTCLEILMDYLILVEPQKILLKSNKKKNANFHRSIKSVTLARLWILYCDGATPGQQGMKNKIVHKCYLYRALKRRLAIIDPKLKAIRGKGSSKGPFIKTCSFRKFKLSIVKMRRKLCKQKLCSNSRSRSKSATTLSK